MSARLSLALRVPLERFELSLALESDARALGLFGPSGAGKTTVLEALAGWRPVREGRVVFEGRTLLDTARGLALPPEERALGYVPQDLLLFPHWSVGDNVRAGARRAGRAGAHGASPERALRVLELEGLVGRSVSSLSGGERQRVALARALCSRPALLLLDEPLASLDLPLRRRILPYLIRVREEFGIPMILVSHDATEVAALCDEVAVLHEGSVVAHGAASAVLAGREGALAAEGAPENVLRGEVLAVSESTASVALAGELVLEVPRASLARGEIAVVAVRADEVLVATERPRGLSARNLLPAVVRDVLVRGEEVLVRAELARGGVAWWVELTPGAVRELALEKGREVWLVVKTRSCRVLSSPAAPAGRTASAARTTPAARTTEDRA